MLKISRKDIIDADVQLQRLGNYEFGGKLRYALRYNTPKIILAVKKVVEDREEFFAGQGWYLDKTLDKFVSRAGETTLTPALGRAQAAFFAEEVEVDLRTVMFEDTGDIAFPANLLPEWMMPLEPEPDEEQNTVKADENGQLEHQNA